MNSLIEEAKELLIFLGENNSTKSQSLRQKFIKGEKILKKCKLEVNFSKYETERKDYNDAICLGKELIFSQLERYVAEMRKKLFEEIQNEIL